MKNRIKIILIMVFLSIIAIITNECSAATYGNFTYYLTDSRDGIRITDYNETYAYNLIIPDTILGLPVTEIDSFAFSHCTSIIGDLVIPDTVTKIDSYAFSHCTGLNGKLVLSKNLTTIGNSAFDGCSQFTGDLIIPNKVKTIGRSAFEGCGFNGKLVLPNGLLSISNRAFYSLKNITGDLVIPNSVLSIGEYAFYESRFNGKLVLPQNITTIANRTFAYCNFSGKLVIPDSVTNIGSYALYFDKYCQIDKILLPSVAPSVTSDSFNKTTRLEKPYGATGYDYGTWKTYYNVQIEKVASMNEVSISSIGDRLYNGGSIRPSLTITYANNTLTEGIDYTVSYSNNIKVGTATVTITGRGAYYGTTTRTFNIKYDFNQVSISGLKNKEYTGSALTQSLTVKHGNTTLKNGTHYTLSYNNNVELGTATVTITGIGNYTGGKTLTFEIVKRSVANLSYSKVSNYSYTGKEITPTVTVKCGATTLTEDVDYTVSYGKNISVGTGTITITGTGEFTGTKVITFKINKTSISSVTIEGLKSKTYTGSKQYQSLTLTNDGVTLKNGTDYTLSYKSNVNPGTATVTITGKGNYTGSKTLKFKIWDRNVNDLDITVSKSLAYTGSKREPSVTVKYGSKTLKKNTDYKVTYSNNIKVGTATITVTGKGNYTGTKVLTFEITKRSISSAKIKGLENKTYTGSKLTQSLKLTYAGKTLKNGKDYTLTYENNVNAGTASVTIKGIGNFYGEKTLTYKISRRSISKLTYSKVSSYTYAGKAITPNVTVKYGKRVLAKDTDYTLSYSKNVNSGTATITITGKGNYAGTKKITFSIKDRSISSATIQGLVSKAYTGKKLYQNLTLTYNGMTLKNGTHYTLKYKNNTAIGKATVTITGKGNFNGTKTLTFKINPPAPKISLLEVTEKNVKIAWSKVSSATGYELYMAKDDGDYTKIATITKNKTINYTIKNLTDGEYSFKVRAYKTVGKTKYYSGYAISEKYSVPVKEAI